MGLYRCILKEENPEKSFYQTLFSYPPPQVSFCLITAALPNRYFKNRKPMINERHSFTGLRLEVRVGAWGRYSHCPLSLTIPHATWPPGSTYPSDLGVKILLLVSPHNAPTPTAHRHTCVCMHVDTHARLALDRKLRISPSLWSVLTICSIHFFPLTGFLLTFAHRWSLTFDPTPRVS